MRNLYMYMKKIIRIIHMHECQIIVKKYIYSFKSIVVECMWLFKMVRVFLYIRQMAIIKKYYKLLQVSPL